MEILGQISILAILFIVIYSITGMVPLIAALYLLLRRGNAFAPDITPPVRLRRWAASFFAIAALRQLWWLLFCVFSGDIRSGGEALHSAGYVTFVMLDYVTILSTIAGTLLAMLQDRRRPVWPVFVAMIPIVAMGGVFMAWPNEYLMQTAVVYALLLYVLLTVYMAFAVRQYGRWLRDNYADLERKEVWFTHVLLLLFMLLFILYALVDINTILLMFLMQFVGLVLFVLLLWRVETLPQLDSILTSDPSPKDKRASTVDLEQVERLLNERCVAPQLYLQHELSREQLAQAVGTNRSYLSQYFSRQGITYNTYINNLRINHFIKRYEESVAAGQSISAQQLAYESGFSSYRTFSRAFTERMGQSVTDWMRDKAK